MDVLKWMAAIRAWSFPLNFVSVTLGVALALPKFDLAVYVVMIIGVVALNGIANVVNEIYDFKYGIDKRKDSASEGQWHPLIAKSITIKKLWYAVIFMSAVALLCGLYVAMESSYWILILGFVGAGFAYFYTIGKKSIKALGLGEVAVFLVYGPLIVESAFFAESGSLSLIPIVVSIPIGLLITLVLIANNIRDIDEDKKAHVHSVVTAIGKYSSLALFSGLLAAVYVTTILFVILKMIPLLSLLVLISAYPAYGIWKMMHEKIARDAPARISRLTLLFGILMIIGILFGHIV